MQEGKEKTTYQKIIAGEQEPEGMQKGWLNLQTDKYRLDKIDQEKRREICRKGGQAVQRIHGKKKTAREALENILTLKLTDEIIEGADLDAALAERLKRSTDDLTLYDLIQIVAAGRAAGGNIKAAEYIRDTYGDKPIERVEVTENITTEADRALMRSIAERLQAPDVVVVADADYIEGTDTGATAGEAAPPDGS